MLTKILISFGTTWGQKSFSYKIGAPALTSRNFKEKDFEQVVEFIHRAVQIALDVKSKAGILKKIHIYFLKTYF